MASTKLICQKLVFIQRFVLVIILLALGSTSAQAPSSRKSEESTSTPRFVFARSNVSALRPLYRNTGPPTTTASPSSGALPKLQRRHRGTSPPTTSTPTPSPDLDLDVLEQSPSDYASFLVWPVPRRQPARRIRGPSGGGTTTTGLPPVKLLQPRPTRPSLYSLDGFVPKPSLNYVFTTEANPTYHVPTFDLQTLGSSSKRKQVKYPNSAEQVERRRNKAYTSDSLRNRKTVSRFHAFARKGVPGQDYPVHDSVPGTSFDCATRPGPGRFADPQAGCQVWHLCPGNGSPHRHSFLCPNGTIFSESKGICDWWYNVHCEVPTEDLYSRRFKRSIPPAE